VELAASAVEARLSGYALVLFRGNRGFTPSIHRAKVLRRSHRPLAAFRGSQPLHCNPAGFEMESAGAGFIAAGVSSLRRGSISTSAASTLCSWILRPRTTSTLRTKWALHRSPASDCCQSAGGSSSWRFAPPIDADLWRPPAPCERSASTEPSARYRPWSVGLAPGIKLYRAMNAATQRAHPLPRAPDDGIRLPRITELISARFGLLSTATHAASCGLPPHRRSAGWRQT